MHFFDVTDIIFYVERHTTVSGIQRVSFEVIKRMIERHGRQAVRLSYWDRRCREYLSIEADFVAEMTEFDPDVWSALFYGRGARSQANTAPTLDRYRNHPLKYHLHALRRNYQALRGNEAHFTKHGSSIAEWRSFRSGNLPNASSKFSGLERMRVVDIAQHGDHLIVLGATWSINGLGECFQCLKDHRGLEISQLIHDLIPIITPEHIASDFSEDFYNWLKASSGYCSRYFANSKNTARDLSTFMDEIGVVRPIKTVPLAQDFHVTDGKSTLRGAGLHAMSSTYKARVDRNLGLPRDILNLSKMPFVLVVGTMESRKNIWRLAQAWQRLSHESPLDLPKLVFAGKPGWYNEDFNQLIKATGNLGGWIQFANHPTDAELAYLYETCLFTATVSLYEGWGLPIGESLFFGKTAVVANNSSMPEVGGDMVEYCDAHSIDSIYAACRKLIAEPDHRAILEAKIASTRLRSWDDVTSDFVDLLVT
ncbi:glycosyltransferase family 4 protein [Roseovarius dicentrarchi]|uniref:glycosyltransferase family 4 protein n=1 Tax=Roseovarius dicentrarchi TaxID=2250573 RepID=UPI000DE9CC89|nr:glycosyltransferase family 1 protein [Roseovarius dicentrarchi]